MKKLILALILLLPTGSFANNLLWLDADQITSSTITIRQVEGHSELGSSGAYFDLGQGSIKRDDFSIDLPEINLPDLGLDQLRILQRKCGGCKQRSIIQRAILALGGGI